MLIKQQANIPSAHMKALMDKIQSGRAGKQIASVIRVPSTNGGIYIPFRNIYIYVLYLLNI